MRTQTQMISAFMGSFFLLLLGGANSSLASFTIDGSSTVYPVTAAVVEEYCQQKKGCRIDVGLSGTGGGFKKFVAKQTLINNASRLIKKEEIVDAPDLDYIALHIAYDGITVVVHPDNPLKEISSSMLQKIWDKNSGVSKWSDVDKKLPDEKIQLFGPGVNSGTFDVFKKEIIQDKTLASNQNSEDDNVIVAGVSQNKWALGYFGYAYYLESQKKLKSLAIVHDLDDKEKAPSSVAPTEDNIRTGSYKPLARELYLYVRRPEKEDSAEVYAFVDYYLKNVNKLAAEVGYIPLSKAQIQKVQNHWNTWKTKKIDQSKITRK